MQPTRPPTGPPAIHEATGADISASVLHGILKLRSNVFIVEQECAYDDIDGLDVLPTTRHLWITHDTATDAAGHPVIVATLRIIDPIKPNAPTRIGRVATDARHRGNGLASRLMTHAIATTDGPTALSAQAHLESWYEGFGYQTTGPGYLEDGIPHVPMERVAGPASSSGAR